MKVMFVLALILSLCGLVACIRELGRIIRKKKQRNSLIERDWRLP